MTRHRDYDIFVCYEHYTGADYAVHVADCLKKRFKASTFAATRQGDIPAGYEDEQQFRYQAIRNSIHFVLVATNGILRSKEVQRELSVAHEAGKRIIVCPDSQLELRSFSESFPGLKRAQRLQEFSDKSELAKRVVDWYVLFLLSKQLEDIKLRGRDPGQADDQLIVCPIWSVDYVSETKTEGRIIFDLKNSTPDPVLLHGYRMFRISPDGTKDFFYKGKCTPSNAYTVWNSGQHFSVILLEEDRHVFNWGIVNIPKTYGIDWKGLWQTEIQISYVKEGFDSLLVSTGKTKIEFR